MTPIDLRSDTITRPGPGMRQAMAEAEVGDDVFGDDPTINRLQETMAARLGKEAALFVPSGTMANQLALRAQTRPGDQVVVEADAHVYRYEAGAPAVLSGLLLTTVATPDGLLTWDAVEPVLNPDDAHCAPPSMLCLENTHNRHGGRILPLDAVRSVCDAAHARGLRVHLDGARLWNCAVATGTDLVDWGRLFDSVSLCFSKGMGAPVGSVLVSDRATIARAHRARKQWGGGMRQAGILAAACLYALDHNYDRLAEDHAHARRLGEGVTHPDLELVTPPDTNIVLFHVRGRLDAKAWVDGLHEHGVWGWPMGPRLLRLVTHLDVSADDVERALQVMNEFGT